VQVVTPGTSAWLDVRVKNNTMSTMSGADVTLSSESEFVTVNNSTANIGTVSAGNYKTLTSAESAGVENSTLFNGGTAGALKFSVASGAPMGTPLPLTLTFSNPTTWTDTIMVTPTAQAPAGLTITPLSDTSLAVSWAAVPGASKYELRYNIEDSRNSSTAQSVEVTETSKTITGLSANTTYYVWVRAKQGDVVGAFAGGNGTTLLSAPTNVTAMADYMQVTVSWTAVSGAASYDLYYNTGNNSTTATKVSDVTSPHTLSGLPNGAAYFVWIKAKNANGESAFSTVANASTLALSAPVIESVTADSIGQLTVNWNVAAGAASYNLYYNTINDSDGAVEISGVTSPSTITGLPNGTIYYIWVKAFNAGGESGLSVVGSMATILPVPSISSVTAGNAGELVVRWGTINGATGYNLYYSPTDEADSAAKISNVDSPKTLVGLNDGTVYYVWVKATRGPVESTYSASRNIVTKPAAPVISSLNAGDSGQMIVNWGSVTGAASYDVYYNTIDNTSSSQKASGIPNSYYTISGLSDTVIYYVWVKAKNASGESAFSTVAAGTTAGLVGTNFTITFSDEGDGVFNQETFTIKQGGSPESQTIAVTGSWDSQEWRIDGILRGTGTSILITANDYTVGGHYLTLTAYRNGVPWSKQINFTVAAVVTGLELNKTTLSLPVNGTETLIAQVIPFNAANKTVTWTSSNTTVATVSTAGLVTAKAAGTAAITATTAEGSYSASCAVTVEQATGITVGFTDQGSSVFSQETFTLKKSGSPTSQIITLTGSWTSQEWRVDGQIRGTGASITIAASDYSVGGHSLTVTVYQGNTPWTKRINFTVEN
jgi:hypothetical protein